MRQQPSLRNQFKNELAMEKGGKRGGNSHLMLAFAFGMKLILSLCTIAINERRKSINNIYLPKNTCCPNLS